MGVRRSWLVLAVLLIPTGARASDHRFSAFVAFSRADNPDPGPGSGSVWNGGLSAHRSGSFGDGWGWHVAGEAVLTAEMPKILKILKKKLSLVGEASGHLVGADRRRDATQFTLMAGPRLGFRPVWKTHTFVHVLGFGAIHRSDGGLSISTSAAALALGGGVDCTPFGDGHWGVRVQIDRVYAGAGVEDSWRYSAGYVYRFPLEH